MRQRAVHLCQHIVNTNNLFISTVKLCFRIGCVEILTRHAKLKSKAVSFFAASTLLVLAGCQGGLDGLGVDGKAEAPIPTKLVNKMKAYGMRATSPIMMRVFKEENVLEVWKEKDTGRYGLLATYEICKWSGKFGPKFKEGDRQAPEGFYTVNKHQLNPNSKYHLSFNMGFPNAYDRSHGRTGSHLMIHGACSSAGCYSMTDAQVQVIYALARDALKGGQKKFQIQAFPFRMTPENLFKHRNNEHYAFWKMLKRGYDHFEITQVPPKVNVCNRSYVFNTTSSQRYPSSAACPTMAMPQSLATAFTKRQTDHAQKFEKLLAKSEKRKVAELPPMTFEQTLPGITVIAPQPPTPKPTPETQPEAQDPSNAQLASQKTNKPESAVTTESPASNVFVASQKTETDNTQENAASVSSASSPTTLSNDPFAAEAAALKKKASSEPEE